MKACRRPYARLPVDQRVLNNSGKMMLTVKDKVSHDGGVADAEMKRQNNVGPESLPLPQSTPHPPLLSLPTRVPRVSPDPTRYTRTDLQRSNLK